MEVRIEPEFRDKIPPLTEAEYEQLKENILSDGEVYEPIIIWNGVIVDGHNRWRIVQEHPEIPYRVKEMQFADKWEASEWMYRKQLGRRNLTDEQKTYMIGKMYEARKQSVGNTGTRNPDGTYASSQMDQNDPNGNKPKSTAESIAQEIGVAEPTVKRAAKFAKGVDALADVSPEAARKVLEGKSNILKKEVESLPKANNATLDDVASAILNGSVKEKRNNGGWTREDRKSRAVTEAIVADMMDPTSLPELTLEDLLEEIKCNADNFVSILRSVLAERSNLLTDENRPTVANAITEYVIEKIVEVRKLVEK